MRIVPSRLGFQPALWGSAALLLACGEQTASFSAESPARGPSEMLEGTTLLNTAPFPGGSETVTAAETGNPSVCDAQCRSYCEAAELDNPVNRGLCPSLWGRGMATTPVDPAEACRRLYADTSGAFASLEQVERDCVGKPWDQVVQAQIDSDAFVRLGRQRWSDQLRYDSIAVSIERIFDADRVVELLYQGRLAYDQFAAVISAHPVLTRRHNTDAERVNALYETFFGRPAFADELSDMGRLYHQWDNGYYDHPQLGMRLPDAYVRYRCTENGADETGECTSVRYGTHSVALIPDTRADEDRNGASMWSGYLSASEWEVLQAPGRLIATERVFWEHAVRQVVQQYLGYDLVALAPQVGQELTDHLLTHDGDIRSVHFAVLTSAAYQASNRSSEGDQPPFARGPVKQAEAETWVDSIGQLLERPSSRCDFRINRPGDLLQSEGPYGLGLVQGSDWDLNEDSTAVVREYRDLVRTLGGCPDNSQGGRFTVVSVLSTANQLNYAGRVCDPTLQQTPERAAIEALLPSGVSPDAAVTPEMAQQIVAHQTKKLLGRAPTSQQVTAAGSAGESCALSQCSAEQFARPACFALVSSAEMLFY